MFSVVIPLYNKKSSIKSTIQSILEQNHQDFEIIVVNDGSTDNSAQIVETIDDARIRLIHQKNQGVSAARNRGIQEAKYEWITFLDADDLWDKNHLIEFKKGIDKFPETKWLFSGFIIDNGNKRIKKIFNVDGKLSNIFDSILSGLIIHTSTVCIKRNLFDIYNELYFRVGLNNSEDREVWYKLACIEKSPIYIAKPLSIYNIEDSESLTKKNAKNFDDHFLTMQNRLEEFTHLIKNEDKIKLFKFIKKFNQKALLLKYRNGYFKKTYKEHLNKFEYFLLKNTIKFPRFVRHIISRTLLCL